MGCLRVKGKDELKNMKKLEVMDVINYIAWYSNQQVHGKMWDSTYNRGAPFKFRMGNQSVFPGLEEAVAGLTVGQKVVAYIPPDKAFGKRGFASLVPPESHLILWIVLEAVYPFGHDALRV